MPKAVAAPHQAATIAGIAATKPLARASSRVDRAFPASASLDRLERGEYLLDEDSDIVSRLLAKVRNRA
jgi:hypothetical protein